MLVQLWRRIFHLLRYVSVFEYIRKIPCFKGSPLFVEVWVLLNLLSSILLLFVIQQFKLPEVIIWIILLYSFTRILEITVYQVNVLLFDPFNTANYSITGYRRMVILLMHNYVEIILWFAVSYMILGEQIGFMGQKDALGNLFFSFSTMVTFGADSLKKIKHLVESVVIFQAIIGLFMTIVSLSRFIGTLPKPKSKDETEQEEKLESEIKQLRKIIERLERQINKAN